MKALLAGVLGLALIGCAGAQRKPSAEETDAVYRNGLDRFAEGDYRTALRRFQTVRDANPKKPGL